VKSGAKIGKGCVLSFGVVVGANVVLPPYTRLTLSNAKVGDEVKLRVVNGLPIDRRLSFYP
jgi:tetrahydrodipicolinate N-succinyltransferase